MDSDALRKSNCNATPRSPCHPQQPRWACNHRRHRDPADLVWFPVAGLRPTKCRARAPIVRSRPSATSPDQVLPAPALSSRKRAYRWHVSAIANGTSLLLTALIVLAFFGAGRKATATAVRPERTIVAQTVGLALCQTHHYDRSPMTSGLPPNERTFSECSGTSQKCRYCSLIPGLGVKLSNDHPCRATVLSAVGVDPPHEGVR